MMKWLLIFFAGLSLSWTVDAQAPMRWEFAKKHLGGDRYEIRLTASIQGKWHLYSQFTPEGGPVPTKIVFANNPILLLEGAVKEDGRLIEKREEVFEMNVKYFEGIVVFRQVVRLKKKIKTKVTGSITYMLCNDTQCLPPKTEAFSISI